MKDAPCRECKNHREGCHGKCEPFIKWDKEHKEERTKKNQALAHQRMLDIPRRKSIAKALRNKR